MPPSNVLVPYVARAQATLLTYTDGPGASSGRSPKVTPLLGHRPSRPIPSPEFNCLVLERPHFVAVLQCLVPVLIRYPDVRFLEFPFFALFGHSLTSGLSQFLKRAIHGQAALERAPIRALTIFVGSGRRPELGKI
jgi:hypothetical protein